MATIVGVVDSPAAIHPLPQPQDHVVVALARTAKGAQAAGQAVISELGG
jgi:hypothetical protein